MSIKLINPAEIYDGSSNGMSQAVVDEQLGLVFISGQVAWDQQAQIIDNTVEGQTKGALENLKITLAAAGSSIEKLLQLRIYVRGEIGEHLSVALPLLRAFLGESRPALTGVGVASLATPETLVEIEAIAKT